MSLPPNNADGIVLFVGLFIPFDVYREGRPVNVVGLWQELNEET